MLGLALSGGGARGIAHLGVLAALDELELPVVRLAGVSSGAIAATFYAAGVPPREIMRLLQGVSIPRLTRVALSRYGLLHMEAVGRLFEQHLGAGATFEQLQLPVTLVATDIEAGESVRFSSGPLVPPLLASSAVPILYRPVVYQGRQLVDGGLLNNLPVEALLEAGHPGLRVVGVHCNPPNAAAQVNNYARAGGAHTQPGHCRQYGAQQAAVPPAAGAARAAAVPHHELPPGPRNVRYRLPLHAGAGRGSCGRCWKTSCPPPAECGWSQTDGRLRGSASGWCSGSGCPII